MTANIAIATMDASSVDMGDLVSDSLCQMGATAGGLASETTGTLNDLNDILRLLDLPHPEGCNFE